MTIIEIMIRMIILRGLILTLRKSRAHMAEHKFPTNWGDCKSTYTKSSQRLVFVERRKPEHAEIKISVRTE